MASPTVQVVHLLRSHPGFLLVTPQVSLSGGETGLALPSALVILGFLSFLWDWGYVGLCGQLLSFL